MGKPLSREARFGFMRGGACTVTAALPWLCYSRIALTVSINDALRDGVVYE